MKNKLDYYTVLSINRNASAAAIKKRFRELAKQYHPDASGDHDTTELFKRITEAYEVLSDPEKRRTYDAKLDAEARANTPRPAFIVCPQNARDYIEKVQARVDREPDGVNRSPTAKLLSRPVNYRMILARWGDFLVFAAATIAAVVSIGSIKASSDHYRADFQQYQTSHALSVDAVLFTRMVTLAQNKDIATFELSAQQYSAITHRMLDNQTNYDCMEKGFAENRDMNAHCIQDLTGNISAISNANQLNKDAVNQDTSTIGGASIALLVALFIAIVKILWNIGQTGTRKLINTNYQERLSYWQQLYCCEKDYIIFLPGKPEALIPLKEAYLDMLTGKEYATIKDAHAPSASQVIRVFALCVVALLIVDFFMTASLGGVFSHNLAQFTVPNVPVVKPSKATIHISGLCQGTVIDNSGSNDILTNTFELQLNQNEDNLYGPFHIDGAAYGVVQVFGYYGGSGSFTGTLDAMGNIEGALSDGGGYERYALMAIANNSGSFSGTIPDSGWGVVTFSAHCSK